MGIYSHGLGRRSNIEVLQGHAPSKVWGEALSCCLQLLEVPASLASLGLWLHHPHLRLFVTQPTPHVCLCLLSPSLTL